MSIERTYKPFFPNKEPHSIFFYLRKTFFFVGLLQTSVFNRFLPPLSCHSSLLFLFFTLYFLLGFKFIFIFSFFVLSSSPSLSFYPSFILSFSFSHFFIILHYRPPYCPSSFIFSFVLSFGFLPPHDHHHQHHDSTSHQPNTRQSMLPISWHSD